MKLGFVTEFYYPHIGGQEQRYFELSQHLAKNGHEVDVFTIQYDHLPALEKIGRVTVHRFQCKNYSKNESRGLHGLLRYALLGGRSIRDGFDAYVLNQWPLFHIPLAAVNCGPLRIVDWCEFGGPLRPLEQVISIVANHHITVNDSIKAKLGRIYGDRVEVIPNGIDTAKYHSNSSKTPGRLLFVGRLVAHKHVDQLIKAVHRLNRGGSNVSVDIVGDGPKAFELRQLGAGRAYVRFHGFISEDAKREILRESWLLVLPSTREGFGRVVAEAIASGVPVLAREHENSEASRVVSRLGCGQAFVGDESNIAEAVSTLIHAPELWERYASRCQSVASCFDWGPIVSKFENTVQKWIDR